jgi:hypothetical protein
MKKTVFVSTLVGTGVLNNKKKPCRVGWTKRGKEDATLN